MAEQGLPDSIGYLGDLLSEMKNEAGIPAEAEKSVDESQGNVDTKEDIGGKNEETTEAVSTEGGDEKAPDSLEEFFKSLNDKPDDWESVLKASEKRVKDNQKSYHESQDQLKSLQKDIESRNQKIDELTKQVADLSKANTEQKVAHREQDDKAFVRDFRTKFEDDAEGALLELIGHVRKTVTPAPASESDTNGGVIKTDLDVQEAVMRNDHSDYDEVMKVFLPIVSSDQSVNDQWQKEGGTAAAAYKIGQKIIEARKISSDPEAFKKKVIEDFLASEEGKKLIENKVKENQPPKKTLSGVNSTTVKKGPQFTSYEEIEASLFSK